MGFPAKHAASSSWLPLLTRKHGNAAGKPCRVSETPGNGETPGNAEETSPRKVETFLRLGYADLCLGNVSSSKSHVSSIDLRFLMRKHGNAAGKPCRVSETPGNGETPGNARKRRGNVPEKSGNVSSFRIATLLHLRFLVIQELASKMEFAGCFEDGWIEDTLLVKQNPAPRPNNFRPYSANNASPLENGAPLSFTNEQMMKLMNLINEVPSGSNTGNIQANLAVDIGFLCNHSTINMFGIVDVSDLSLTVGHPNEYCVTNYPVEQMLKDSKLFVGFTESKCYIRFGSQSNCGTVICLLFVMFPKIFVPLKCLVTSDQALDVLQAI
ncbi:hypothetical protein Tco_1302973 [Tanacetum coccineum]